MKRWVAVWPHRVTAGHPLKRDAVDEQRAQDAERVVRVVEVRRGEVVVDVERLREALAATRRGGAVGRLWVSHVLREAGAVKP